MLSVPSRHLDLIKSEVNKNLIYIEIHLCKYGKLKFDSPDININIIGIKIHDMTEGLNEVDKNTVQCHIIYTVSGNSNGCSWTIFNQREQLVGKD